MVGSMDSEIYEQSKSEFDRPDGAFHLVCFAIQPSVAVFLWYLYGNSQEKYR